MWEEEVEEWNKEARRIGRAAAKAACNPDFYDVQTNRAWKLAQSVGALSAAERWELTRGIFVALLESYCDGAAAAARRPVLQRKRLATARKAARADRHAAIQKVFGKLPKRLPVSQRVETTAKKLGVSTRTVYRAIG